MARGSGNRSRMRLGALGPIVLFSALTACSGPDERPPSASSAPSGLAPSPTTTVGGATDASATLVFKRMGQEVRTISLRDLLAKIPSETVKQFDPYYGKDKTYRAVPLGRVLDLAFDGVDLAKQEYVLRAKDGYTVPMRGALATEPGAYVAFEDVDVPGWEPIGQQHANPGPFYVVWAKRDQIDLESHPRPYQLATIEIARFDDLFPHTVPTGIAEGEPARRGFATFKEQCILCHAVNREGGRVGPELNVPQSIVEYRPAEQIKAYIKNPLTFRYSQMPPHPSFTDGDLDDLVAYFAAMKDRKHDADASKSPSVASPAASASATPSARPSTVRASPPPPPRSGAVDPFDSRQ